MLIALKIVHFFCLFGGGAAMIGNGILIRKVMASSGPPDPIVADTMKRLGMIGLASVVLLWLTGIAMVVTQGPALEWSFYVKLAAAALVLAVVVLMNVMSAKARRAKRPPDISKMKTLSLVSGIAAALAVIFAVVAFS